MCDEEWRTAPFAHVERFEGFDACLCFEAGQLTPEGDEAVVVKRKAAGTLVVRATGVSAHSGSAPDRGKNALLALAGAAQSVAEAHDPAGPDRLTAVPTVLRSGEAFNVVPSGGRAVLRPAGRRRRRRSTACWPACPTRSAGPRSHAEMVRLWPSMDARERDGRGARAGRRAARAGRSSARGAAGRATPATWPRRSR